MMVKRIVCDAGKDSGCDTDDKTKGNTFDGRRFQRHKKIVYGTQMLDNARKYQLMPEEIFSEKIGRPTMGLYARRYFTTSQGRQEYQWQSLLSMLPTAMTE